MWEPSVIVEQKLKVHFKVIITKTFTHSDSVWIVSGQSCVVFLILWREPLCSVVGCRVHSAAASFILTLSLPPTFILTAWWKQEAAFRPAEQSKREDLQLTMTWHTGWNTRRRKTNREGKEERAGSGLTMILFFWLGIVTRSVTWSLLIMHVDTVGGKVHMWMREKKKKNLKHWTEATAQQNKLECYLSLNRELT